MVKNSSWAIDLQTLKHYAEKLKKEFERINNNSIMRNDTLEYSNLLIKMDEMAGNLAERLYYSPIEKLIEGQILTEEEYYLLASVGMSLFTAKQFELSDFNDFEIFSLMHLENGGYINPGEHPLPEGVGKFSFGVIPENIELNKLSEIQIDFFKTNLPEVYQRFKSQTD